MGALPFPLQGPVDTSGSSGGSDQSGWLTGLTGLFSGVGSAISSGLIAANLPTSPTVGSGWVFNPATGQYYNPTTGQALTSTGTLTSAGGFAGAISGQSTILLILVAVVAVIFLARGRGE